MKKSVKETAVSVKNLVKRFGSFYAVNDISFDVNKGEIFGFLGPNGAGKSTTIKILCGIIRPSSGDGSVLGYSVNGDNQKIRESIGYMSQKFSLYNDLTVQENLEFFGSIYGLRKNDLRMRIKQIIEIEGLSSYKDSLVGSMPGGIKQKLALSASIIHDPGILFLDEPTSGVDPKSRRNFWDQIYSMTQNGKTVFVTTHYMDEAEHCSRIAMIIAGKIIALDTPSGMKNGMAEKIISVRINNPVSALPEIINMDNVIDASVFGTDIHVVTLKPEKNRKDLLKMKRVISAEIISPSLEDLFVIKALNSAR